MIAVLAAGLGLAVCGVIFHARKRYFEAISLYVIGGICCATYIGVTLLGR